MTMAAPTNPHSLTDAEASTLRLVVADIIPASTEHALPSANDPIIFADIVQSLGRDAAEVRRSLALLDELLGAPLPAGGVDRQRAAIDRFRAAHPDLAAILLMITAQCYYRDDRVMRSIGMEPRPPFPQGFVVEQGDWSLLDEVRARGNVYRDDQV